MFSLNYILNIYNNLNTGEGRQFCRRVGVLLNQEPIQSYSTTSRSDRIYEQVQTIPWKDPTQPNDSLTNRTSLLPRRNWQQLGRLCEQTRRTDTAENKTLPL